MAKICQYKNGCPNAVFSHDYCRHHQWCRTDGKAKKQSDAQWAKTIIKRTSIKRNRKPTGEGEVFKEIIATRKHVSFISGLPINNPTHCNCMHVLSKKQYPEFRLYKKNMVFGTLMEHHLFDNGTEQQRADYAKRVFTCDWKKLFDLKEQLIQEYKEFKLNSFALDNGDL